MNQPLRLSETYPLTAAQRDIWLDQMTRGDSPLYTIGGYLEIKGTLDPERFQRAVDLLIKKHDALRTVLHSDAGAEGVPRQTLADALAHPVALHDFSDRPDPQASAQAWMQQRMEIVLPLDGGLLFRFYLLKLDEASFYFVAHVHHIILDGWGISVMFDSLGELYSALESDRLPDLSAPSYVAFIDDDARYRDSPRFARDQRYWLEKYQDVPEPLFVARYRDRYPNRMAPSRHAAWRYEHGLNERVDALAQAHQSSRFAVLLAALYVYFVRTNQREELVIGLPILNRSNATFKKTLGLFTQVSAVRLQFSADLSFGELVRGVARTLKQDYRNQRFPLSDMNRSLGLLRDDRAQLFDVSFSYEPDDHRFMFGEAPAHPVKCSNNHEQTPLAIHVRSNPHDENAWLHCIYNEAYFQTGEIEVMADRFQHVLEQGLNDDGLPIQGFILPTPAEALRFQAWNTTDAQYEHDCTVHGLFEAQAAAQPDAVAVVYEDQTLTYGALNARANQVAHRLLALGVCPDDRVAICVERGLDMIVGLLGILKSGAGYVPLDPAYPRERLAFMLDDSAPVALLTQSQLQVQLPALRVPVLLLDQPEAAGIAAQPQHNPDVRALASHHLAYVIYTSGSTGLPKGVMVEHRNVARLFSATQPWFDFNPQDVWALFHSFAFDFSVWEIWGALTHGGRLLVVPQLVSRSPQDCYALLCAAGVTVLNQTPSAFRQLIAAQGESDLSHSLRQVVFGGEALETGMLKPWYAREANAQTQLVNMYGITETTVHVTYRALEAADAQLVGVSPIGKRIPDLRLYLLDQQGQPVPMGVEGELYVGGAGVARGYLNRPQLNQARFMADPFDGTEHARMYRTGDLGRWLENGELEYLGRNDEQVKIRGFRIELGEIEAKLTACESVREAVVIAREDEPGDKRLVAYVIAKEGAQLSAAELRAQLLGSLAEYMVPSAFVMLTTFPLTTNGKLDRKALPAPDSEAYARRTYEAPVGAVEITLAGLWAELLGVEQVGRHDRFFELGGHSLLAVKLIERMRQVDLSADVRVLFGQPTLATLAAAAGASSGIVVPANGIATNAECITADMLPLATLTQEQIDHIVAAVPGGVGNVQDIYGLVPLQEGILYHHLATGDGDPYLLQATLRVDSRAQLDAFVQALQAVIERHDILRTSVAWEGLDEPVQVVWREARLGVEELTLDQADGDIAGQLQARFDPRHIRFDLRQAPLMRIHFAEDVRAGSWVAVLLFHHLIDDATSLGLLGKEIEAHLEGRSAQLPVSVPYRNYVAQVRLGLNREQHEAFFSDMLGDVDEPTLPFGLQDVQGDGSGIEEASLPLCAELGQRLRAQARRLGVSTASLHHLAWGQVVGRVSGRTDVVFGTVLMGRLHSGQDAGHALGMFVNTLPLRVEAGGQGVLAAVKATHARLAALLGHEHAPLSLAQRCSGVAAPTPLFSALMNYRQAAVAAQAPKDAGTARVWAGVEILGGEERTNYPLSLSVDDLGESFGLTVQAVAGIGAQRVCAYMHTVLEALADALDHDANAPLHSLAILPDPERRQLLDDFNAFDAAYPSGLLIHQLFEAHADARPEAVAVTYEDQSLSYGELNRLANQVAHRLLALGIRADDRVAICVDRGLDMVAGLIGILKAGAGYVPLDPAYPAERLAYMLEDSAPKVLLTQRCLQQRFPQLTVPLLLLDAEDRHAAGISDQPQTNPDAYANGLNPESLAYVIYTSGSTGQPKGVAMAHRPLVNLMQWQIAQSAQQGRDAARTLQFAALGFDVAFQEVFSTLCAGGELSLIHADTRLNFRSLFQHICAQRIERLYLPCIALQALAETVVSDMEAGPLACGLRDVITAGEQLRITPQIRAFFERLDGCRLHNHYGPTESHVTTALTLADDVASWPTLPAIGQPVANTRIYLLDEHLQPVPIGVAGEIHIGGACVARGYLSRADLTAERFIHDPFAAHGQARLYKTGDLGRYQPDGCIEYLGRNDDQIKIRGFRVELGEIEARLCQHAGVKEATVLAREDSPGDKRLVAYFTAQVVDATPEADSLRAHLQALLPDYMIPAAYVRLEKLPLSPNGKLDRRALPAPEADAFASREYQAPLGDAETTLARLWAEVLGVERVGRHDHFFELGGHSLLAVKLIERMRQAGLSADVRVLFGQPTLAALAAAVGGNTEVVVPANGIPHGCERITPAMLTLMTLSQAAIDRIVATVPGGVRNVQDIYPLAPLQEGILYHHISATQGDPYLLQASFVMDSRAQLDGFVQALQVVIDRHDILRTAVLWEGLDAPLQVVLRKARLVLEEVEPDPDHGDVAGQLGKQFDPVHCRLDLGRAPLMRLACAWDAINQRWVATLLFHHIALDHTALDVMQDEMLAYLRGESERLSAAMPYRNYVAQALLGVSREQHESFFRDMLGDVDEPTLPFGLREVQGDGSGIEEVKLNLDAALCLRLRRQARQLGVSAASLHHLAWARVLGRLSGREDVVFGTVLLGRMQSGEGADRALGMFINTLPLRVDVGACSVRSGVKQTHGRLTALLAHEHAPLTLAQRCSGVAVALPLFSALLNYRHSPSTDENGADLWAGIEVTGVRERTNYPCTLSVDDQGEGFLLSVQTFASIGAQRIADYMYTALQSLVDALEHAPDTPLHSLEILPGAERRQLLVAFNLTDVDYPRHPTIHQRFEAQAARHPDTVAVVYGAQRLTYGELNRQANRLAHRLLALGVRPEDRVAICMRRSLETVVGLVAILKSGACYVPMDPSYPAERLAYMLKDSSPVALLTQQVLQERLPTLNVPVLLLDADRPQMTECAEDNPMVAALTPESLAYIIYTSGSTGEPKGVMVEHRNLDNLVSWHCQTFELEHGSRTSSVAGFGFDAAAWEVWPALCAGATLLLPPAHAGSEDVDALLDWWQAQALDVSFLPTPIAEYAFGRHLAHDQLRTLLIGGDRLRKLPADQPFALINNYGPTETTIVATSGRVDASQAVLHIGKPVANTRVYLLDTQLQPVPVGVTGELYIGGAGVARGYLNRSTLTTERFVQDPFSPVQNARMYRSGDLGRYLPDGNIEYLGRNDGQLKIRGFRIELGEIESRLGACTGVREAVVIAVEDALGDKRLVAYYTAHDSEDQALTADSLRAQLQVLLPEYMVPAAFMRLDALPLTPNGKLDRRALPVPDSNAYSSRGYQAPQGEMETVMADIWRSLLGVERISRHDDFFELGGHSLLAVRLTSQVRQQLGVELGLAELFANPELSTLAAMVMQAAASTLPPIVSVPRNEVLPLSFAQQRLWFLAQMEGGSAAYHIAGGLRLKGRLEPEALHWALERIVARHEALRTTFNNVDGEAVQCIATEGVGFALAVHDLAHHTDVEGELTRLAGDEAHAPFDLEQGPLIRGRLVRLSDDEHVLLVTMHHIVSDGWSMSVLTRELGTLYHARLQDEADPLPPLSIQYVDYAVWQRRWLDGDVLSEQKAYWQEALAHVPPLLMLPTDRARPAQQDYCGATLDVEFDQALTADLKALSQRHGTTLYMTVMAGWAAVLGRLSGQETIVIGSPVANRTRVEVEGLIGFFVNTLALPIDVSGQPSVETLLQRVKAQTLSAQAHQDLPFEQVVEAVKPVRSLAHSPLFQAMLSWHNTDGQSLVLDGLTLETMGSPGRTAKFDVSLNLGEANGVISGGLEYATALFDHTTMQRYLGYLERMLRAMVANAQGGVSEIALLNDAERQRLDRFNATETKYPRERTIHSLFETRVERTPDALAIVLAEQCLSYRELNTRANRLARHLMGLGVQPGDRVAIVLPRSIDLVVSQLAILKCAAVYVPLDINAPLERQHFMVQDSQAAVVLTHSTEVVAQGARRVDLDIVGLAAEASDDLTLVQSAESVAYVMYTSGSTGTPKGVLVPHRAISRLVINNGYAEFNAQDRVAFASNPAFDASTLDVW
ncbi:amino acid adenylation domain-containing protein, partial [Pseudomonas frederiksbergensis]|nr:amino acid adenylation domain-containing protein [Pseudomonas frederiksbergensis]